MRCVARLYLSSVAHRKPQRDATLTRAFSLLWPCHPVFQVTHVEPWMSGNARGPSTAFCCLNRLFELQPTPRQVRQLLQHPDSPYIRAVRAFALRCGVRASALS